VEILNSFDDANQACLILQNDQLQYSLWPDFSAVPAGWQAVFGPAERAVCHHWLETHWQDMRPASPRQTQE
jgi:MbtH protein